MNSYKTELQVAKEIAKKAGEIMLKYFDIEQEIESKADKSMVTIADKEINSLVIAELAKHFDDLVIGEEESTGEYGRGRRWFCDPIDGTKAYVWGTPTAMFSLGLVIDGEPVLGVAYDPFLDRLYEGVVGRGSYCNDKKLQVSSGSTHPIVGITSTISNFPIYLPTFENLKTEGFALASFSGAVFKACQVARGKFVGAFFDKVNGHDMAAVQVIVEEAGGKVTNFKGEKLNYASPFLGAIVSNGPVHEEILNSLELMNK